MSPNLFFIASGVGLSPLYCGHFWAIVPSPNLTPCDFYLRVYVRDQVYQPPMPQTLRELREEFHRTDESQFLCTWEEFKYHIDICRITNGGLSNIQVRYYEFPDCFQVASCLYL
jgi:hypothetical protein